MPNLFGSHCGPSPDHVFDLKGKRHGRYVQQQPSQQTMRVFNRNRRRRRGVANEFLRQGGTSGSDPIRPSHLNNSNNESRNGGGDGSGGGGAGNIYGYGIGDGIDDGDGDGNGDGDGDGYVGDGHCSRNSEMVLLDENYEHFTRGEPLPLLASQSRMLQEAFDNDARLLARLGLMDYSILVGVTQHPMQQLVLVRMKNSSYTAWSFIQFSSFSSVHSVQSVISSASHSHRILLIIIFSLNDCRRLIHIIKILLSRHLHLHLHRHHYDLANLLSAGIHGHHCIGFMM